MIGLCLAFEQENNYGTQLQAYATVKKIQSLGYSYEIIIYHKKYSFIGKIKQIKRLFQDGALKNQIHSIKRSKLLNEDTPFGRGYRLRRECVKKFKNKFLFPKVKIYEGYEDLVKGCAERYSTILVGSDQVWLPAGYASKFYNLMFVPDGIHKISYASSFGVNDIPSYHRKEARYFLNRMDFISVREVKGRELVQKYSDKDATVVVDPTLLVDPTTWEEMCVPIKNEEYIFCYFLGTRRACREQAEKLSKLTGLKIIVLKHLDGYIPEDDSFGDEWYYDVGPEKFISFIKNASYVLTDSFHGTVFSIIFQKQFITFYRNEQSEKQSKNSRIDSLLGQLELTERIFKEGEIKQVMFNEIDYNNVYTKLSLMRKASEDYLIHALESCETK